VHVGQHDTEQVFIHGQAAQHQVAQLTTHTQHSTYKGQQGEQKEGTRGATLT